MMMLIIIIMTTTTTTILILIIIRKSGSSLSILNDVISKKINYTEIRSSIGILDGLNLNKHSKIKIIPIKCYEKSNWLIIYKTMESCNSHWMPKQQQKQRLTNVYINDGSAWSFNKTFSHAIATRGRKPTSTLRKLAKPLYFQLIKRQFFPQKNKK